MEYERFWLSTRSDDLDRALLYRDRLVLVASAMLVLPVTQWSIIKGFGDAPKIMIFAGSALLAVSVAALFLVRGKSDDTVSGQPVDDPLSPVREDSGELLRFGDPKDARSPEEVDQAKVIQDMGILLEGLRRQRRRYVAQRDAVWQQIYIGRSTLGLALALAVAGLFLQTFH